MRNRIQKPNFEKVLYVNPTGFSYVFIQTGNITSGFQTLNRRENINRPTCKYFTPTALIEKVEYAKSVKQAERERVSGAIKETRQWVDSLLVRTDISKYNVA